MNQNRNPVGWFEIYVQDMTRAKGFYERTLEVKLTPLDSPIVQMLAFPGGPESPGATGALVKMQGKDSGGGGTIVYFSCADCGLVAARAVTNGGRVFKEKFSIGQYGYIALAFDTEDNMIGLHSMQ
jgi:uncharacterized protein